MGTLGGIKIKGIRYKPRNFGFYFNMVEGNYNGIKDNADVLIMGLGRIKRNTIVNSLYDLNKSYKYYNGSNLLKPGATASKIVNGVKGAGKLVKRLGPVGSFLTAGNIVNEIATDSWDAHTIIDGALLTTTAVVATVAAAPVVAAVAVGTVIYGAIDYVFDVGDKIDSLIGRESRFGKWLGSLF